jgi:hypothetical protein
MRPVISAKAGFALRDRPPSRYDAADLGVEVGLGDTEVGVDPVPDMLRAGGTQELPGVRAPIRDKVANVVRGQALESKRQVAAHQVVQDAVWSLDRWGQVC